MKTIFALALTACLGTIVNAQNNPAPAPAAQPAVTAPATPAPAVQPAVAAPAPVAAVAPAAAPAPAMTMAELRKKHIDAVAALKKSNIDAINALRAGMKGKPRAEIMKAVEAKKAEQKAILKDLEKANKAEIEQFKKDHPKMAKPVMPKK